MKDLHEQIEPKEYVVGAGEDPWTMTSQWKRQKVEFPSRTVCWNKVR
jgi:hypothetical protein